MGNVLYAMPASLYSAKARSYLRKQGIEYVERAPGDPRYLEEIIPAIGRWIIPVLVTEDRQIVQDTVDIIDHFERSGVPCPAYPPTARHRIVAHVLELFGGEGLLRPAMHYRWNFDDTNLTFLSEDFAAVLVLGADRAQRQAVFEGASGRMRRATTAFGVTADTVPAIERSYHEFLELFAEHLEHTPYLLGGRPTLGDYAFMGPLFPHLARDPFPSVLMKQRAPRVFRWVERMNTAEADASEYGDRQASLFADDEVPTSLRRLLGYIAEEYLGEVLAYVAAIDEWLAEHPEVEEGDVVGGRPDKRFLGTTTFPWRGLRLTVSVVPYRLYLLQRLQGAFAQRSLEEQGDVRSCLQEVGLDALLELRARRRVERRDNREVWGASQEPVLG